MKKTLVILLPLLFILLTVACGAPTTDELSNPTNPSESTDLEEVKLLLAAGGNAMYYTYIAQANGYFVEEGIDIQLVAGNGGKDVVQRIIAEEADFGIVAVPSLLPAWNEDSPIQVVYQINSTNLFDVIVPKYSDITNFNQLKGKVIGVTELNGAEVPMVHSLLASAGLNVGEDVAIQEMGNDANAIQAAFDRGDIAAYSGGAHDLVGLYAKGFKSNSLIPREYKALPSTGIIATGQIIEERPDLVEKISRAIARGTDFSLKDRNAALEIMRQASPEEFTNELVGTMCLDTFIDLSTPIETEKGYGYINLDLWEKLLELYSTGEDPVLTKEIDKEKYLNTSFLEKANQFNK